MGISALMRNDDGLPHRLPPNLASYVRSAVARVGYKFLCEALGMRVRGEKRNKLACHAFDREDKRASAVVFTHSGLYLDSGSAGGRTLHVFDVAKRMLGFEDDESVAAWFGQQAGLPPLADFDQSSLPAVASSTSAPAELETTEAETESIDYEDSEEARSLMKGFLDARPGLSAEAMQAYGFRPGRLKKIDSLHAPPVFAACTFDGPASEPAGTLLARADGQPWWGDGPGTRLLEGDRHGWLLPIDRQKVVDAVTVAWCESWSDALAVDASLRDGEIAVAGCGADSVPADVSWLRGKHVVIVGDTDNAGVTGAEVRARAASQFAASVRIAQLPYEVTKKHGKDLRNYINEHGHIAKLFSEAAMFFQRSPADSDATSLAEAPAASPGVKERSHDPDRLARETLIALEESGSQIVWFGGEPWQYRRSHYVRLRREELSLAIRRVLKPVVDRESVVAGQPALCLSETRIRDVAAALRAQSPELGECTPPFRISAGPATSEDCYHLVQNGVLRFNGSRFELIPHKPEIFATSCCAYDFDINATCPTWDQFLAETLGDQRDAARTLQQFFGLCLTHWTHAQKALLLVGPTRSGKGTIARVLKELVGPSVFKAASVHDLSGEFGLQSFLNARVACFADVRLDGARNARRMAEVVLNITGEDEVLVNRKHLEQISVRLRVKLLWVSNEVPLIADASSAVANRFEPVQLTKSFAGSEDTQLEKKLRAELPGILQWALAGLRDYVSGDGRLASNARGRAIVQEMVEGNSPVRRFISECCDINPSFSVPTVSLRERFARWAEANGERVLSESMFGRLLKATGLGIENSQARDEHGRRCHVYKGIRLRPW